MVKHKLKRCTMKVSSRKNGSLLAHRDEEETDSDVIQEFSLPKRRIIKPGKSSYTARRRWSCCRTCASVILSLILIASIMCVVVLGWFSLRLKRDLDSMKKRVIKVESFDRSTSKEYADLQKDVEAQMAKLQHNQDGIASVDKRHFLSLLKQIAFLNRTVGYLKEEMKSPQSAVKITQDIESLKKGMADISQEITQVKDQVAQLKKLAVSQNSDLADMRDNIWNLTVQVGQLTGEPVPTPPKAPSTPPLILRVPIQSDISGKKQSDLEMYKNLTTRLGSEVGHLRGLVNSINGSLASRINVLEAKMEGLVKNIREHMVQVDELSKEVESFKNPPISNVTDRHSPIEVEGGRGAQMHNVSAILSSMEHDVGAHGKTLSLLMSQMAAMNSSIHEQSWSENNGGRTTAACNCSGVLRDVKRMLDADEKKMDSLKSALDQLKQSHVESEGKSPSAGPVTGISPTTPPSTTGRVHNAPSTVAVSTPEISSQQVSNASEAIESDAAHNPESDEEKLEGPAVPISHAQVNETGSVEGISTQAPNGTEIAERSTDTLQTTADKLVSGAPRTEPLPTAPLESTDEESEELEESDEAELET